MGERGEKPADTYFYLCNSCFEMLGNVSECSIAVMPRTHKCEWCDGWGSHMLDWQDMPFGGDLKALFASAVDVTEAFEAGRVGHKPTRGACAICGAQDNELVSVACVTGDIVKVCRHGHFQGEVMHPYSAHIITGMTGPKPLDSLRYFPEGFVPHLRRDLWQEVRAA